MSIWPNNKIAAVSLSYDDGIKSHYENVAPELESYGLRGTFYVPIISTLMDNPDAWRAVSERGHELGNHTCFHPCRCDEERMKSWLEPGYDLRNYSARQWKQEVQAANFTLSLIDGKKPTERSFGNTCNHTSIGSGEHEISLDNMIAELFIVGRGASNNQLVDVSTANYSNLGTTLMDGKDFNQFQDYAESAIQSNNWLLIEMHGIGKGTHTHFTEQTVHTQICKYLQEHSEIWVATVAEIGSWLKQHS